LEAGMTWLWFPWSTSKAPAFTPAVTATQRADCKLAPQP
jgi:hypothetical protein